MTQARGVQSQLIRMENAESAYGTDPSSVHSVKLPFNTCGVVPDRNLITPMTIRARPDPAVPAQGYTNLAGPTVVPVDQCAIGYWLEALMGAKPTSTATGSAYKHLFKVNSTQGSFAYEKGFLDITAYEKLTGVKVGGMTINVGGDEELTASFDMTGKNASISGSTMNAGTTLALTRFNQFHASMSEAGSVFGIARNFTLNVNRNLDTGVYLITSGSAGTRGDLPAGICNVNGTMDVLFENSSYYVKALSGSGTSLALRFQAGSFYLLFDIEEAVFKRTGPAIDTHMGLWLPLAYEAYWDTGSKATVLMATLVNTWACYSGHV